MICGAACLRRDGRFNPALRFSRRIEVPGIPQMSSMEPMSLTGKEFKSHWPRVMPSSRVLVRLPLHVNRSPEAARHSTIAPLIANIVAIAAIVCFGISILGISILGISILGISIFGMSILDMSIQPGCSTPRLAKDAQCSIQMDARHWNLEGGKQGKPS
jgi:hypothetical protein